jgi:hypothetical protein
MTDAPKITKEELKPCGCHVTEYSDDTVGIQHCPACGILEAAESMNRAAQALAGVAGFLKKAHNDKSLAAAVASVRDKK